MTFYDDIYPFYPLQRTPFIFSGRLLTIILVFLVLAVSLLLILPGIRGKAVSAACSVQRASWCKPCPSKFRRDPKISLLLFPLRGFSGCSG